MSIVVAGILQGALAALMIIRSGAAGTKPGVAPEQASNWLTDPTMFMLLMACGQAGFLISTFIAAAISPVPFRERLRLEPPRQSWPIYPLTTIGSIFPIAVGFALGYALTLILPADESVQELIDNITPTSALPFVLFIAIVPGIVEELLYRGYMQSRLLQRWSPFWAISVTSIIFALMHGAPHAIIALLPIAIYFGVVAWRSASVFPSMCCHAFINGSINAWRMVVKFADVSETIQTIFVVTMILAGAVCFFWSFAYLFEREPRSDAI